MVKRGLGRSLFLLFKKMLTIPKQYKPLYVRFKDIPKNGKSGIYVNGIKLSEEEGVSCYNAIIIGEFIYIIMTHVPSITYYTLITEYNEGCIPLYIIDGEEIGIGVDGEPLLKNPKIIRCIKNWKI